MNPHDDLSQHPEWSCSWDRVLEAADAILGAEAADGSVLLWRHTDDPDEDTFALPELAEAMAFLRRLGVFETPDSSDRTDKRATPPSRPPLPPLPPRDNW